MYSTTPIHWNIKFAPASPVGPALYVFSLLEPGQYPDTMMAPLPSDTGYYVSPLDTLYEDDMSPFLVRLSHYVLVRVLPGVEGVVQAQINQQLAGLRQDLKAQVAMSHQNRSTVANDH